MQPTGSDSPTLGLPVGGGIYLSQRILGIDMVQCREYEHGLGQYSPYVLRILWAYRIRVGRLTGLVVGLVYGVSIAER